MTVTIPERQLAISGDFALRAMMADSDKDEHLLMSAVASRWAPHVDIEFATDGAEMLLKLAFVESVDELPSVIILNRYMPRYDGLRTLCELQAHPVLWQIPVVVVVDQFDVRAEIDCYRAGARWVQTKAQDLDQMAQFLERVEAFAAPAFSYHPCGSLDLSLFNTEYAADIELSLEPPAVPRKIQQLPEAA